MPVDVGYVEPSMTDNLENEGKAPRELIAGGGSTQDIGDRSIHRTMRGTPSYGYS